MPATKMLVVYSVAQSRVRRVILPDFDIEIYRYVDDLMPGEANVVMDWPGYFPELNVLNAAVAQITGTPTLDDEHHVVDDKGNVVATYKMDPTIDDVSALGIPATAELVATTELDQKVAKKQAVDFAEKVGVPVDASGDIGMIGVKPI